MAERHNDLISVDNRPQQECDVFVGGADSFSRRGRPIFFGDVKFSYLSLLFVLGVCFLQFGKVDLKPLKSLN